MHLQVQSGGITSEQCRNTRYLQPLPDQRLLQCAVINWWPLHSFQFREIFAFDSNIFGTVINLNELLLKKKIPQLTILFWSSLTTVHFSSEGNSLDREQLWNFWTALNLPLGHGKDSSSIKKPKEHHHYPLLMFRGIEHLSYEDRQRELWLFSLD